MTGRQTVSTADYAKIKKENEILLNTLKIEGCEAYRTDGKIDFIVKTRPIEQSPPYKIMFFALGVVAGYLISNFNTL